VVLITASYPGAQAGSNLPLSPLSVTSSSSPSAPFCRHLFVPLPSPPRLPPSLSLALALSLSRSLSRSLSLPPAISLVLLSLPPRSLASRPISVSFPLPVLPTHPSNPPARLSVFLSLFLRLGSLSLSLSGHPRSHAMPSRANGVQTEREKYIHRCAPHSRRPLFGDARSFVRNCRWLPEDVATPFRARDPLSGWKMSWQSRRERSRNRRERSRVRCARHTENGLNGEKVERIAGWWGGGGERGKHSRAPPQRPSAGKRGEGGAERPRVDILRHLGGRRARNSGRASEIGGVVRSDIQFSLKRNPKAATVKIP